MANKKMEIFSPLEAVQICAALEDCLDQLAILGYIMPVSYEGRTDISNIDAQEISEIVKSQKELGVKFEHLMSARSENRPTVPSESLKFTELGQQLQETSGDLKRANHLFSRAAKQSAVSSDNLRKVQADRQYASDVIAETLQEMQISGTFQSLLQAVRREEERKSNFYTTITREEEGRKEIKSLQKRLQDVKKEKELELQNRNEMIAYLKDQLQEMKAKTDMESRYLKKDTELQVYQTQKKCSNSESDLFNEIETLRIKNDEEIRVHVEIENFLRQQQMKLEEKLEYWMEKYEKDTEAKQQELNTLKASKANDLAALQELAKQCQLFEQVIIEDRVEKEAARRKVEQDALELKSVKKLQAWWRGTMVRHNIGPYKALKKSKEDEPKGKDKGKKGKAGAKKKK
uniref:IQ motif containing G n=1 Tax=Chrysemys picta bellii TaxID=8478 RepID=A0A8C3P8R6_CHRPI|nr:dynein regulatory complex protein 9 isoform X1 [Chrysemys picta bellii]XP_042699852.1 dynein regulatory complex protein 9 isoform X1 [Chrysemys picta bellii]XP_042699853.1 dynein regulatory complex protein 9 isoform X1 [Chrysemys picta bellii]XP_042699854.1 dynein regulatory complex protein 9 isoform X1 [Chrysemys picta bellii]